jgi:hypothetical protein
MIFSVAKQQLIKNAISTDNGWLVDRLSWLVKEIARAVLVQDKKLDDLIKPIYDTYEQYHHDNDNKNLKKKDLLFGKVLSKVFNLTHPHEYYQIAYLDSLTILSRSLLPPQPPSGGGGRRTRKHRTKRRTRSEKKRPRRTRKKKNKKQRMSRKRNKSTKT